MAVCANCGKTVDYGTKYCDICLDFLDGTGRLTYAELWKYRHSAGGCIGCRSISGGDRQCEDCLRSHMPTPPFIYNYTKG